MLKERLQDDLKSSLLSGDKFRADVIRNLKSAVLYEEVAKNARATGLDDDSIMSVIAKEMKKRMESIELYQKAGEVERAERELAEVKILKSYLPQQLSLDELKKVIDETIAEHAGSANLGAVINEVRKKVGQQAEGATIAELVKAKLSGK